MISRSGLLCALLLAMLGAALGADLAETDRAKAAALVKELGSDDYAAREGAEKALKEADAACYPFLKEALKAEQDTEIRNRLQRVLKDLALRHEHDPEALSKLAREDALAGRFETAEKFYRQAADRLRAQAATAAGDEEKKELLAKAAKAGERMERAKARAAGGAGVGQEETINLGQGNMKIQVIVQGQAGGNAGRIIQVNGQNVRIRGAGGEEPKEDW